jgi:WD40 repeat protein
VDQMSSSQSREVLLADGLAGLNAVLVEGLLAVTGQWPLLLRLVNKILVNALQSGADVDASATLLLERLRADGPAVVDDLSGRITSSDPDMDQPEARAQAVRATIRASTSLLDPQDAQRFEELGVFAEDEVIPFPLAAGLWRVTAGLDDLEAAQLSARLAGLALISLGERGAEGLELHDVIRDFLRAGTDQVRLARLNSQLVEASAVGLPRAESLDPGKVMEAQAAWWELDPGSRYLHDHLITHLINSGRTVEAEEVAADLRWVSARLQAAGPAGPVADLAQLDTPLASRLQAVLEGATHLLAPTRPERAVIDILFARVSGEPHWAQQAAALQKHRSGPRLISRWPLPDLPNPSLRRVIPNRAKVTQLAIAADGRWLAIGGEKIRIVDSLTGRQKAEFTLPRDEVLAMKVTSDGRQLVVYTVNSELRVWNTDTWQERTPFAKPHARAVAAAIAPDGTWLATAAQQTFRGGDKTVRFWDASERSGQVIDLPSRIAVSLDIAPDGTWLAAGGGESITRIWDIRTGRERAALVQREMVTAVAISPDGSWLATGDPDGIVCFWDAATWQEKIVPGIARALDRGRQVNTAAVAPDGTWLATGHANGEISLWDAATQRERMTLAGHTGAVTAVVIAPDGTWLATGGDDGTVRIWDPAVAGVGNATDGRSIPIGEIVAAPSGNWLAASGAGRTGIWATATGHELANLARGIDQLLAVPPDGTWIATSTVGTTKISAVNGQERAALSKQGFWVRAAASPDGAWLATGGEDGTVMVWDTATWRRLTLLRSQTTPLRALAVAPDGSWLAAGGEAGRVQIWDTATWDERASFRSGRARVSHIGIAPDGSWLASADDKGLVRIWDTATWRKRAVLKSKSSWIESLAVAPDGNWIAVRGYRGRVGIWDASTWRRRGSLVSGGVVAISPSGAWLAAADKKGTLWVWNTATWQAMAMMRVDGAIAALAWIDHESLAAGGSSGLYQFSLLSLHLICLESYKSRSQGQRLNLTRSSRHFMMYDLTAPKVGRNGVAGRA